MVLAIIAIIWLAGLAALVLRLATVRRRSASGERTGQLDASHERTGRERVGQPDAGQGRTGQGRTGPEPCERSPRLLEPGQGSFEQAIGELLEATPAASSSKAAPAEHVGDGAHKDLYVGP